MKLDLNNLLPKSKLNPKFWKGEGKLLCRTVKKNALVIAKNFISQLGLTPNDIEDIIITGSLANYNWSTHSDLDLHIIVDYDKINAPEKLLEDYFKAKRQIWNNQHDVTIHGHEVEVYVQNADEPHFATGIYSVFMDKWLAKPSPDFKSFDKNIVAKKTKNLIKRIEHIESLLTKDPLLAMKQSDLLQDKLKKLRSCGLEHQGEYSAENLAYKLLRRTGYLDILYNIENQAFDQIVTIA